ncbi:MAG: site-specific DNA-methyltransferase [Promethearchaeota archaeon]|nr:MAG: site-specific DNA-methyltransferase [Candidatus Lokiarchaeota archaeon]
MVNLNWGKKDIKKYNSTENLASVVEDIQTIEIFPEDEKMGNIESSDNEFWRNTLFWGDNLTTLTYLIKNLKEKIDLIYIDPPFFTGDNFYINVSKNGDNFQPVAYSDRWNNNLDEYIQMLYERIILFRKLLSKKGLLFVHLDWHMVHYIKLVLDEIFGKDRFINNIVWYYYNKYSAGKRNLPRAHDDILVYSKTNDYTFNEIRIPREQPRKQLKRKMVDGVLKNVKDDQGHVVYRTVTDKKMDDVWKIPCLQPASKQWTGFPNQKHHKLLERIVRLGSNKDDLVADFFCGAGTTLLAAERLQRRWIGCDISKYAIYLTRKRLLDLYKKKVQNKQLLHPFELKAVLEDKKKRDVVNSGFFDENLTINRKK